MSSIVVVVNAHTVERCVSAFDLLSEVQRRSYMNLTRCIMRAAARRHLREERSLTTNLENSMTELRVGGGTDHVEHGLAQMLSTGKRRSWKCGVMMREALQRICIALVEC